MNNLLQVKTTKINIKMFKKSKSMYIMPMKFEDIIHFKKTVLVKLNNKYINYSRYSKC